MMNKVSVWMQSFLKGLFRCGNLNLMVIKVSYLFVLDQRQFLLHICIQILVMFRLLQEVFFLLCVISTVFFLINNSGGGFLLSVSAKARFFPAVQTICRFWNFH